MYAQLSEDEKRVISVFGSPQDPEVYSNLVEIEEDDPRYVDFIEKNTVIA